MNMRRLLISLLSLAALAVPTSSWEASTSGNLAITVTAGQAIAGVSLSNSTFTGGAASGTIVGTINVTMSPTSPAFSGTLSLSGTNASSFQIVGSNLETNGSVPAGTYKINIIATETGAAGSPSPPQAETITGTAPPPIGVESPGPSQALFNSPYYTCNQNWYVATTGSDTIGNGTSGSPWATLQHAHDRISISGTGSWCVNVAPGSYSSSASAVLFSKGGTTASANGYFVFRCQTLDGCTLNGNDATMLDVIHSSTQPNNNYVMFDGFTMVGIANPSNGYGIAVGAWDGGNGSCGGGVDCSLAGHHVWVINSVISNFTQSGLQLNDGEYFYAIHNKIYNNATEPGCPIEGSGISLAALKAFSYVRTADDSNANNSPALNMMGVQGPSFGFNNVVAWNVIYNNYNNCISDGNGIIFDSDNNYFNSVPAYTPRSLVVGNVIYNNGGAGVWVLASENVTVANNSCYNNVLNTSMSGTARPCLGSQDAYGSVYINNTAYAIVGASAPLNSNNAFQLDCNGGTCDSASNNVSYCTATPATAPCEAPYNGATYSCVSNKCSPTLPGWVNVGNTSSGSASTPANGTNFALQASSPAIGYGLTESYLPAQSVDAGACYHTLASCP
jgi:hypothetical protein